MLIKLFQRCTIENICGGARPIEGEHANPVLANFAPDLSAFAFRLEVRSAWFREVVHEFFGHSQILSSQMAAPWPPPTHSETRARCACLLLSSRKLERMSL